MRLIFYIFNLSIIEFPGSFCTKIKKIFQLNSIRWEKVNEKSKILKRLFGNPWLTMKLILKIK